MSYNGKNNRGGRPLGKIGIVNKIAAELKVVMAKKLKERFGPVLDAQLDAAFGIQTEHFDRKTGNLYYKEPGPNTFAFKTIAEQVVGKPKESVELSTLDGKPIMLPVIIETAIKKIYGRAA